MAWFSLFGRGADKSITFEKDLSKLAAKIDHYENSSITLKSRLHWLRKTILVYGLLLLVPLAAVAVIQKKPLLITIAASSPLVLYLLVSLLKSGFEYFIKSNNDKLKKIRTQQKTLIEDYKKQTGFYQTQKLLDRYDKEGANASPKRTAGKAADSTPSRGSGAARPKVIDLGIQPGRQAAGNTAAKGSGIALGTVRPEAKTFSNPAVFEPTWFDKVLDRIVGIDETSAKARYALICGKCKNHNGLAPPGELPDAVNYICPHCGFENGEPSKAKQASKTGEAKSTEPSGVSRVSSDDDQSIASVADDASGDDNTSHSSATVASNGPLEPEQAAEATPDRDSISDESRGDAVPVSKE